MKTKQEQKLSMKIRGICAGHEPGDVLCALLHRTIEVMQTLDKPTREQVEMEYVKTLVYLSATRGDFVPEKVRKIVEQRTDTSERDDAD